MYRNEIPEEGDIIFTVIDLQELIEKFGVKAILEEMPESLIEILNGGIKSYYIRKANRKLNNVA